MFRLVLARGCCLLLVLAAGRGIVVAQALPPSFVIFLADDVGYGDLPCYGNPVHSTPHLDALNAGGIRFTDFHNAGPGDHQSLYALLTGRSGARSLLPPALPPAATNRLDPREWTLAGALSKAGYACSFLGAWRLGASDAAAPARFGFSGNLYLPWSPDFSPYPPLRTDSATNELSADPATLLNTLTVAAEDFLERHTHCPFLLLFHPPARAGVNANGTYIEAVAALDDSVARLMTKLDQLNLRSNTLFLFLSDAGPGMASNALPAGSTGGMRDARDTGWEGGVRVPCIASWPGTISPGQVSLAPWWMPDLFPTLAQLAQAPVATNRPVDGVARWDLLSGSRTNALGTERFAFHHAGETNAPLLSIRVGAWKRHAAKRIQNRENPFTNAVPPFLFNMETDPFERHNVAATDTQALAGTTTALQAWLVGLSPEPGKLPPADPPFASPLLASPGQAGLRFEFERPHLSYANRYELQWSTNLFDWISQPLAPLTQSITPLAQGIERVQAFVPVSPAAPMMFVRLHYLP